LYGGYFRNWFHDINGLPSLTYRTSASIEVFSSLVLLLFGTQSKNEEKFWKTVWKLTLTRPNLVLAVCEKFPSKCLKASVVTTCPVTSIPILIWIGVPRAKTLEN